MMTAVVPKTCVKDIQRLQRGFIWGDTVEKKRAHLIKWDTLMLPKEHGGLGVRNLDIMNTTCLMKLAWGLKDGQDQLWCKVLDGKYGRGSLQRGDLQVKVSDFSLWKSIASCWDFFLILMLGQLGMESILVCGMIDG